MTINRFAARRDANEPEIVAALERCGVQVWRLNEPCDLLTLFRGRWLPMEIKTRTGRTQRAQERQAEFLASSGCPVVRSPQEAIEAVITAAKFGGPDARDRA